jgi:hypothetical protein
VDLRIPHAAEGVAGVGLGLDGVHPARERRPYRAVRCSRDPTAIAYGGVPGFSS